MTKESAVLKSNYRLQYALTVSIVALMCAAAAPSSAEDAPDEIIVTGTRVSDGVAVDKLGSSVTVISAQDFEDRQTRIVSDVLRDIPGFAVSRAGAVGNFTQIRVRGSESNHVLTLIDGIEAADPFFGEFDYATLLADDVARIEVIRGPQSALYGSDAIAGMVNYITPTATEQPGWRVRLEGGSQNTIAGALRFGYAQGAYDWVVNAGYQNTDGYVTQTLPGGQRSVGSQMRNLSSNLNIQATDQLSLRGVIRYSDTHADTNNSSFGRGIVDSYGTYSDAESLHLYLGGELKLLDDRWTHNLSVQGVDAERNGFNANVRSSGNEGKREKASYVTSYNLESDRISHRLTGAVDWEKETYQNTSPPTAGADTTRRSIKDLGVVGQYDLGLDENAGLGAAVRHDDNTQFRNATTYRVHGYYRFNDVLRLRSAVGSGIKNPTQTELFGFNATGPFPFVGNQQLKPEKAEGWEVGLDVTLFDDRMNAGFTYFDQRLENEIFSASRTTAVSLNVAQCPPPPVGFTTTCNRLTTSKQKGVELFADIDITDTVSLSGSYTHLDATENTLEEIRRAPNIASANLTWRPFDGRSTFNLNARFNGDQYDNNFTGLSVTPLPAGLPDVKPGTGVNAGRVLLPSYTLLNLSASYDITENIEVFGRIENLTDEDYYEIFGYRSSPRAAYGGVRLSF